MKHIIYIYLYHVNSLFIFHLYIFASLSLFFSVCIVVYRLVALKRICVRSKIKIHVTTEK